MTRPLYPPPEWRSMTPRQRGRYLDRYKHCLSKSEYVSLDAAERAVEGHPSLGPCSKCERGLVFRAYLCRIADHYHVGHKDPRKRTK